LDEPNGAVPSPRPLQALRSPATIRERCRNIAAAVDAGESRHFTIDRGKLAGVADRVAAVTRQRYPDGKVPLHSRWRHFEAGGVDRKAELDQKLASRTVVGVARARVDLVLVSVLLDAGAGERWSYRERETGLCFQRSEGLAVATFRGFMAGAFSSDVGDPYRVDAKALLAIDEPKLAAMLQAGEDNPIVGLPGRVMLLRRLGETLRAQPELFTADGLPGHLFDAMTHHRHAHHLPHANLHHLPPPTFRHHLSSARVLEQLLEMLGTLWPSGVQLEDGTVLGDVWRHPHAGGAGTSAGWVPFHKLPQWLAYSLVEPFEWAGVQVNQLDELTGLPEYRNGGLLLDGGVLVPRDQGYAQRTYSAGDEWVVEWRALTVVLLDQLAPLVRERLGLDVEAMNLARMLEGGTWAAGRELAQQLRADGAPPVHVASDGTLF
jgi:hypothetical protein